MLSCVHQIAVYRGGARAAGLLALGTGVSWLGGMPQISLMVTYLVLAYGVLLAVSRPRGRRLPALGWMAAGLATGLLVGAAQIVPVLAAASVSSRGEPTVTARAIWSTRSSAKLVHLRR